MQKDKTNKNKDFFIIINVCFFMVLIIVLWFFNIKNDFQTINAQNNDFQEIKQTVNNIINKNTN